MYNMQSGILRRTFDIGSCPATVSSGFRPVSSKKKEERCITGLASDALDRTVIASTLDGTINVSHLSFLAYLLRADRTRLGSSLTSTQQRWSIRLSCHLLRCSSSCTETAGC